MTRSQSPEPNVPEPLSIGSLFSQASGPNLATSGVELYFPVSSPELEVFDCVVNANCDSTEFESDFSLGLERIWRQHLRPHIGSDGEVVVTGYDHRPGISHDYEPAVMMFTGIALREVNRSSYRIIEAWRSVMRHLEPADVQAVRSWSKQSASRVLGSEQLELDGELSFGAQMAISYLLSTIQLYNTYLISTYQKLAPHTYCFIPSEIIVGSRRYDPKPPNRDQYYFHQTLNLDRVVDLLLSQHYDIQKAGDQRVRSDDITFNLSVQTQLSLKMYFERDRPEWRVKMMVRRDPSTTQLRDIGALAPGSHAWPYEKLDVVVSCGVGDSLANVVHYDVRVPYREHALAHALPDTFTIDPEDNHCRQISLEWHPDGCRVSAHLGRTGERLRFVDETVLQNSVNLAGWWSEHPELAGGMFLKELIEAIRRNPNIDRFAERILEYRPLVPSSQSRPKRIGYGTSRLAQNTLSKDELESCRHKGRLQYGRLPFYEWLSQRTRLVAETIATLSDRFKVSRLTPTTNCALLLYHLKNERSFAELIDEVVSNYTEFSPTAGRVIALHGLPGSGKSSVGQACRDLFPLQVVFIDQSFPYYLFGNTIITSESNWGRRNAPVEDARDLLHGDSFGELAKLVVRTVSAELKKRGYLVLIEGQTDLAVDEHWIVEDHRVPLSTILNSDLKMPSNPRQYTDGKYVQFDEVIGALATDGEFPAVEVDNFHWEYTYQPIRNFSLMAPVNRSMLRRDFATTVKREIAAQRKLCEPKSKAKVSRIVSIGQLEDAEQKPEVIRRLLMPGDA